MSEIQVETVEATQPRGSHRRDWLGTFVGLGIILGGMAILYLVFKEAWSLFATPPAVALKVEAGKPIDLGGALNSITGIVVKIILLVIMAWLGSVIANRGIFLYGHSRPGRKS